MSVKEQMRAILETGGVVRRDNFPHIQDSTFRSQVQNLRSAANCGKGKAPLNIVLDKAAGGYRLWTPADGEGKAA